MIFFDVSFSFVISMLFFFITHYFLVVFFYKYEDFYQPLLIIEMSATAVQNDLRWVINPGGWDYFGVGIISLSLPYFLAPLYLRQYGRF
jgi:hypothetical protein